MGYKEGRSCNGEVTLLQTCFAMFSTPSTSNAVPVPISIPMEVDSDTDSEVEQCERAEVEEMDRLAAAAQKKSDENQAAREQHRKERAAAKAAQQEAARKMVELEAAELARMQAIEVSFGLFQIVFGN